MVVVAVVEGGVVVLFAFASVAVPCLVLLRKRSSQYPVGLRTREEEVSPPHSRSPRCSACRRPPVKLLRTQEELLRSTARRFLRSVTARRAFYGLLLDISESNGHNQVAR